MIRKTITALTCTIFFVTCTQKEVGKEGGAPQQSLNEQSPMLTESIANQLVRLPLKCTQQEYPNKLNQVLGDSSELGTPKQLHPSFYGCFDWHSSVHGHWVLVALSRRFSDLEGKDQIRQILKTNLSKENIAGELDYFKRDSESSFERTYGWAWLLKLARELHLWDDPLARELEDNLIPLTHLIVERYLEFLPKLYYPIRTGEHPNTAFGMSFALDYAQAVGEIELSALIVRRAKDFYLDDKEGPLSWEPNGFDFLSPCMEEANLMRKILSPEKFQTWLNQFLPQLGKPDFEWKEGLVSDRTDGKLVHLDGLNFSRAWCLSGIAKSDKKYGKLNTIAQSHINYSLPHLVSDSYEGGHWLASFALYAIIESTE